MLDEQLLEAWVGMTYMFKNNRLTKGLTYNESTILMYLYQKSASGTRTVPMKYLLEKTKMTKSLLNRTIESLIAKQCVEKVRGKEDGRTVNIQLCRNSSSEFRQVHQNSLDLIRRVIDVIGEDDAKAFIRIYQKLENQDLGK